MARGARSETRPPKPTRNASGLTLLLRTLGWSGRDAAHRLGISHATLIELRDGRVRPGQVVMDTVMDSLRHKGMDPEVDALFPRDDKPSNGHEEAV